MNYRSSRHDLSLIQQHRGGYRKWNNIQRSGKCLGTQRREGGPSWERDRGRDKGSLKALILKGDSGGKGWVRIKEGRPLQTRCRIGSGDLSIKRRESRGGKKAKKSRERGSQEKARGGRGDRVMGETEQRVQGKGRGGGQHCASQWGLCAVWRGLGPGCSVCVRECEGADREAWSHRALP